jgi:hypothetical protein
MKIPGLRGPRLSDTVAKIIIVCFCMFAWARLGLPDVFGHPDTRQSICAVIAVAFAYCLLAIFLRYAFGRFSSRRSAPFGKSDM